MENIASMKLDDFSSFAEWRQKNDGERFTKESIGKFKDDLLEEISSIFYEIGCDDAIKEYQKYKSKFLEVAGSPLICEDIDAFFLIAIFALQQDQQDQQNLKGLKDHE
jgi:hypothetical protein